MRFLIALLLVAPLFANAAYDGISLTLDPDSPRAEERVVVTATLIGADAQSAVFVWTIDGNEVAEGVALTSQALDTPALGDRAIVEVTAVGTGGTILGSGSVIIQPAEVTLEWEGRSIVPPFYKGRPHLTGQGTVSALAVPAFVTLSGARIPSAEIFYSWRVDGKLDSRASGYGRSTYSGTTPFFNSPFTLGVSAVTRDEALSASDEVRIVPFPPQIIVYEYSPLGGVAYGNAIVGSFPFDDAEVSFMAYPLFAAPTKPLPLTWSLNGAKLDLNTGDPRLAIFKKTGEGSGTFDVGVEYESPTQFLEKTRALFQLQF